MFGNVCCKTYQFPEGRRWTPTNGAFVSSDDYAALSEDDERQVHALSDARSAGQHTGNLHKTTTHMCPNMKGLKWKGTYPQARLRIFQPHRSCTAFGYMVDSREVLVTPQKKRPPGRHMIFQILQSKQYYSTIALLNVFFYYFCSEYVHLITKRTQTNMPPLLTHLTNSKRTLISTVDL